MSGVPSYYCNFERLEFPLIMKRLLAAMVLFSGSVFLAGCTDSAPVVLSTLYTYAEIQEEQQAEPETGSELPLEPDPGDGSGD